MTRGITASTIKTTRSESTGSLSTYLPAKPCGSRNTLASKSTLARTTPCIYSSLKQTAESTRINYASQTSSCKLWPPVTHKYSNLTESEPCSLRETSVAMLHWDSANRQVPFSVKGLLMWGSRWLKCRHKEFLVFAPIMKKLRKDHLRDWRFLTLLYWRVVVLQLRTRRTSQIKFNQRLMQGLHTLKVPAHFQWLFPRLRFRLLMEQKR